MQLSHFLAKFCALLFVALLPSIAGASPKLDPSFGSGGIVMTRFGNSSSVANAAAIQPDGKILLVGYRCIKNKCYFALARYKHNGSLDETFGKAGKVVTRIGLVSIASSIVIQRDGRIVVGGKDCKELYCDPILVRYKPDGMLDKTFGTSGIKIIQKTALNNESRAYVSSLVIQQDQKIIAAGTWGSSVEFSLARFNRDGSEDSSFGQAGHVQTPIAYNDGDHSVFPPRLSLQSDGKILAAGGNGFFDFPQEYTFVLVRYDEEGQIDRSFGHKGFVRTRFMKRPLDFASGLVIHNGKALATGTSDVKLVMARYDRNGAPDLNFGRHGKVVSGFFANTFNTGNDSQDVNIPAVTDGSKIISAGYTCFNYEDYTEISCLVLFRLNADGTPDLSFGDNGVFVLKDLKGYQHHFELVRHIETKARGGRNRMWERS